MLPAQDAASARSQKQEERPGVLQEEGEGCQEQDKKANDIQTRCESDAVAQGLGVPKLRRPQKVSILDDLVGEEASLSTIRGGARRSTLQQVQDRPRHQQHVSQESYTLVIVKLL